MMISPQYTPFSAFEVRQVLGLTNQAYDEAIATGIFNRSVHFDCRVSSATSLHNLFDVVEFEVSSRALRMGYEKEMTNEWLYHCLDIISYFFEALPENYEPVNSDELKNLFERFLGVDSEEEILRTDTGAGVVLITIQDVFNVCIYCYQKLKNFLLTDAALEVRSSNLYKNRLCCTTPVWDSSRESSVVAGMHEQTDTTDLQDQELASL